MNRKVVVELPARRKAGALSSGLEPEMEVLDGIADVIRIESDSAQAFVAQAGDADGIVVTWGVAITRDVIEQLERCAVIGVASVGVDMVDLAAATDAGIVVTNVPDVFIEEVADHTMMLLLATARRLTQVEAMIARGDWNEGWAWLSRQRRLLGQTLGLIAFGNTARAVARRGRAFGLQVIAFDPYVSELKMTAEGVEPVSFGELLERSDFLSVHPPHNQETEHMLSAGQFARMKPTAALINCARGPIVDEKALIEVLEAGGIAAAALDVLEKEPPDMDNPLLHMPNVILTPHVASATTRMRPEARRRAAREVAQVLRGKWPLSCVNPTVLPRIDLERWQPYPMERGPNR